MQNPIYRTAEAESMFFASTRISWTNGTGSLRTTVHPNGAGHYPCTQLWDDGGPPLILLHAASTYNIVWKPNIEALAEYFRVHAIDILGEVGLSVPIARTKIAKEQVEWLAPVLDELEIDGAAIAGGVSWRMSGNPEFRH